MPDYRFIVQSLDAAKYVNTALKCWHSTYNRKKQRTEVKENKSRLENSCTLLESLDLQVTKEMLRRCAQRGATFNKCVIAQSNTDSILGLLILLKFFNVVAHIYTTENYFSQTI